MAEPDHEPAPPTTAAAADASVAAAPDATREGLTATAAELARQLEAMRANIVATLGAPAGATDPQQRTPAEQRAGEAHGALGRAMQRQLERTQAMLAHAEQLADQAQRRTYRIVLRTASRIMKVRQP